MLILGPLGFTAPYVLLGFLILPVLWWLLRVTPPPPQAIAFPAIRLLRDLVQPEETPARTPLWLILLRLLLAALLIVGLAGLVLHPEAATADKAPLVIVVDNGWASAVDWPVRQAALDQALDRAERAGRRVAIMPTAANGSGTAPLPLGPDRAASLRAAADALQPEPWPANRAAAASAVKALNLPEDAKALWLSDGINTVDAQDLANALAHFSTAHVLLPTKPFLAELVLPPAFAQARLSATIVRPVAGFAAETSVNAVAEDGRVLATATAKFAVDDKTAAAVFDLPVELTNQIGRLALAAQHSAGGTVLLDTRWRRRAVGIASAGSEGGLLVGNTYLKAALEPFADLREGTIETLLKRPLSMLLLDDPANLGDQDQATLKHWMEEGGVLVRFAGPHLSAAPDDLLPVKLRTGDRALGGALSWSEPAHLAPFLDGSPFVGLPVPPDVTVSRQVLADPAADLAGKTWATLTDGTPLVTAQSEGKGLLVLVHTTAGPDWSNLALSGTFVEMLRRLGELGNGTAEEGTVTGSLAPAMTMDGFAVLHDAPPTVLPVEAAKFDETEVTPNHPPGLYGAEAARRALNLTRHLSALAPLPDFPSLRELSYTAPVERSLKPWLLTGALLLLAADTLIALWLKGLLRVRKTVSACLILGVFATHAHAASMDKDLAAATSTTLGYIITGDPATDRISAAGLAALTQMLIDRTSVEEAETAPVNIETDDLAFYPLLYWPITETEATPSTAAIAKLNIYLANGGLILFDTRNGEASTPALRRLSAGLAIPPLMPIPSDHTLGKSFYLLNKFPGRLEGPTVWVERSPSDRNDAVSSVIVGANDWAGEWADGAGDRQQELSYRFGINLVMYALTGNYKSDQVHTPAILQRLVQ